jgi:membrane protein required for colicin V production
LPFISIGNSDYTSALSFGEGLEYTLEAGMQSMIYDLFSLAVLALTTFRGASKGMAWQVAGIASLVLCFLFATPLSIAVAPYIRLEPPLNRWVSMLAIYLVFSFGTFTIARSFREWLEKERFIEFDRHLGAVFGLIKGTTICLVMTFFVVAISENARAYILTTSTGYASAKIMDALHPVMPEELHTILEPYIHELDQSGMELAHDHGRDGFPAESPDDSQPRRPGYRPIDPEQPASDDWEAPHAGHPNSPQTNPQAGDTLQRLEELVRRIPGVVEQGLEKLVLKALADTAPEQRPELVKHLQAARPEQIRDATEGWHRRQPTAQAVPANPEASRERHELIEEISRVVALNGSSRGEVVEQIDTALAGVPAPVALAVLADWRSDLLAIGIDPDSETDVTTRLDVRIVRQMNRARVPLNRLTQELQDRLRAAERR